MQRNGLFGILALLVALLFLIIPGSGSALRTSAQAPARQTTSVLALSGLNMPCTTIPCAPPPGAWVTRAPLPVAVYGSGVASDGVVVYSAGGTNFSSGVTHQFVRYDPLSNRWSSLPPLPSAVEEPLAIYAGGKFFVLGGLNSSGAAVALVQIYNIAGGSWSTGAPMPDIRQKMGGGYANGKIYAVGGYQTSTINTAQNQTWEYTLASDSWISKTNLPVMLGGPASGVVNGHLYILGGRDISNTTLNSVYDYNIAGDAWTSQATMPSAVNLAGSAVYAGKIWLFGGGTPYLADGARSPNELETVGVTQIYDPAANSWVAGPAQTVARSYQGGAVVRNQILSVGGYSGDASAVVEMAVQNPLRILIVYADSGSAPTRLQTRLLMQPGVGAVDLFDGESATPTLVTLAAYDLVVPFSNAHWANASTLGDALADFQDTGGIVVAFNFDWDTFSNPINTIGGRWSSGNYSPFNLTGTKQFSDATLGSFSTGHPLLAGVNTLGAFYRQAILLAPGATLVASWSDSQPLVAFKGQAVGVNAYIGDFLGRWSGDYAALIVNAGYWLRPNSGPCTSLTCGPTLMRGQLNAADGTQTGRLNRGGAPSTCASPRACPAVLNPTSQFHYDTYPFVNNTPGVQCVTVTLDASGCAISANLFSAAYLSSFDPSNLCTNYLADMGTSSDTTGFYSFSVPAWNAYSVVVHEVNAGTYCPAYSLVVSGGACPAGPVKRSLLPFASR